MAAQLAVHFWQGRDYRRTVQYLRRAGENAAQGYARREAIEYLMRAPGLIDELLQGEQPSVAGDLNALAAYAHRQGQVNEEVKA
jgi:hypothetical protein